MVFPPDGTLCASYAGAAAGRVIAQTRRSRTQALLYVHSLVHAGSPVFPDSCLP